jgi:hypothetical protein
MPVIKKKLVDLEGAPMAAFAARRAAWAAGDCFRAPGPLQVAARAGFAHYDGCLHPFALNCDAFLCCSSNLIVLLMLPQLLWRWN